jgi:hypothetical protein
MLAHALTDEVRGQLAELGEEELEYAALSAAAQESLALLSEEDQPRRVVVVAEAPSVLAVSGAEPSLVEVDQVIPLAKVVAVHVDSEDAGADVEAARGALDAARAGEEEAETTVDRCLDHELGWFATQEIGALAQPAGT